MIEKINRNSRVIIIVMFVLMTLIGLVVTPDYGMPWDEELEIRTLGSNVREYIGLFKGEMKEPNRSSTGILFPDYKNNVDMDHGQSAYYPISPALFAKYGPDGPRTLMLIWHTYTFLIFMAGVVGLYFVCNYLAGDWKYGALGSLLMYLSPRFFAEGHYNSKDIVVAALVILCIALGIKMIETKRFLYSVLFALAAAVATNMRITALFMFGLLGILYVIHLSVKKEWCVKNFFVGLTAVLAFLLISYLITPAAWRAPIEYIKYVIDRSSNFEDWNGLVFFQGYVRRPVPAGYIPTMIAVTTPILVLALILLGNITAIAELIRNAIKKKMAAETPYYLICIVFIWTFLLFAMIRRPILYNSWRHLYFLYGPMLILAVGAVKYFIERARGKMKGVIVAAVAAQLLVCAILIGYSHPFQYVYFNPFAGKDPAVNYEFDYWNVSQTQILMRLVDQTEGDEPVRICAFDWYTTDGLQKAFRVLPEYYKKRVILHLFPSPGVKSDVEYLIMNRVPAQIMEGEINQNLQWIYYGGEHDYATVYPVAISLREYGSEFMTIYKMSPD